MHIRVREELPNGSRAVLSTRFLALVALSLAACRDAPTAPLADGSDNDPITEFTLAPGADAAAKSAKLVGMHKLATLPNRVLTEPSFSATGVPTTNSPFDLTYFGGPVLTRATSYNVYVNCSTTPASCWGTGSLSPKTFLKDLNASDFIRLVNEYTGSDARGKFPAYELKTSTTFTANSATFDDIEAILISAVGKTKASGYSSIYHVFLPRGTEVCIVDGVCYSPDHPENWVFCAFHGAVDFLTGEHVLFSVEPYQGVDGCRIPGQTPHGVIDATASTLGHELLEVITDPDLNAWFNGLFGFENADLCSSFATDQQLNGHNYFIQSMYSNKQHACTNSI
jgi:hypothetical protein